MRRYSDVEYPSARITRLQGESVGHPISPVPPRGSEKVALNAYRTAW